jgi:hypothetical protein
VQISEHETAHEAWPAIQAMYASQSRSRIIVLRRALNDLKKREMSAVVYFNKLKGLTGGETETLPFVATMATCRRLA